MDEPNDRMELEEQPTAEDLAFEKKLRDAEAEMLELEKAGWQWRVDDTNTRLLSHPDDPEMSVWHNPYSGDILLSPKLVERLAEDIHHERSQSEDNP